MIDIVMPKNNEEMLIKMAERLGYAGLCFFYERIDSGKVGIVEKLQKKTKLRLSIGSFSSSDVVFGDISARDAEELAKSNHVDVLVGFESLGMKDRFNQRSSGLDPVLCKLMSEKKKVYCIDFGRILSLDKNSRAVVFGRIRQNLMLCRKYKIKVAIASFASEPLKMRNPLDLSSLLAALGHDEGKRPLEVIEERAIFNRKKREGKIVMEGVEVM